MTKVRTSSDFSHPMTILSSLLLPAQMGDMERCALAAETNAVITAISKADFDNLVELANLNHVIVRSMQALLKIYRDANDDVRAGWAEAALTTEQARINNALPFLHDICAAFEKRGHLVTVIKSLDHWPDLGNDLDLFTSAAPQDVFGLMQDCFKAEFEARSWGDRLAGKWNFRIPGLPESVEIHIRRLGQTGEQASIARALPGRARKVRIDGRIFPVTSNSDRLMISTLQRMYRHFFFRLCDIVDSASLVESGAVDFEHLQYWAKIAGIWEGVATYLAIVSDYVEHYRVAGLNLPQFVTAAARFGGREVFFRNSFLRVPIMPQSARLYGMQLTGLLRKRELHNSARLGLLPWLATAAMVGQKITGSDKGIW